MKQDYNYILFQGNFERLSSFSIINRILIAGLRDAGYRVELFPTDGAKRDAYPTETPDVYIFHGHPYDITSSPGRFNIFILNYEYFRMKKEDSSLIGRLNDYFDLVLVATNFVKDVLLANGLKTPVGLLPWGVNRQEFNPQVKPRKIPGLRGFSFIYAGVFTERKGLDVLVDAYVKEFGPGEDVTLVIKEGMRWPHYEPWIEKVMELTKRRKPCPKIIHISGDEKTIAGYFTACDAGVFPFRGEGFGLPVLECIASGRRVIVTNGTGPLDFCTDENALFVDAAVKTANGKSQLEPDTESLRRRMREAFEEGRPGEREQRKIADTVSGFRWENTLTLLRRHIDRAVDKIPARREPRPAPRSLKSRGKVSPSVTYSFFEKGQTSWKKTSAHIDRALREHFGRYEPVSYADGPVAGNTDMAIGQSGYALEQFVRSGRRNPDMLRILYRESGPIEHMIKVVNRERKRCGLETINFPPMDIWRNRMEALLSDHLILLSENSKRLFVRAGYPEENIRVLRPGIILHKPHLRDMSRGVRFLFVGTDSFRKGIRVLLEAWDQLKLRNAELICISDEIVRSRLLLSYLVRNHNIIVVPPMPYKRFVRIYETIDCQVLPSFEDGFSFAIGEGMGFGKPAIVSADTGISEILTHMRDGILTETGSVESLKEAILYVCENRRGIKDMGQAAYETAAGYPWRLFERNFVSIVSELYGEMA